MGLVIATAAIAQLDELLPPVAGFYQYVIGGNGLFIRAEDSRLAATVPIAFAPTNPGWADLAPEARLKVARVPGSWLGAVLQGARACLPDEVLYQFRHEAGRPDGPGCRGGWICRRPAQQASVLAVRALDDGAAVIDLHSHHRMTAEFSATDWTDEQGFRLYAVIGRIDTAHPEIRVEVGVYGHRWPVPALDVFDDLGPFIDAGLREPISIEAESDLDLEEGIGLIEGKDLTDDESDAISQAG